MSTAAGRNSTNRCGQKLQGSASEAELLHCRQGLHWDCDKGLQEVPDEQVKAFRNCRAGQMRLSCCDAGKDCTEIVTKAFMKTLAIAKVGFECELKMCKLAQQNHDAHTSFFLGCCAEQKVCLSLPNT